MSSRARSNKRSSDPAKRSSFEQPIERLHRPASPQDKSRLQSIVGNQEIHRQTEAPRLRGFVVQTKPIEQPSYPSFQDLTRAPTGEPTQTREATRPQLEIRQLRVTAQAPIQRVYDNTEWDLTQLLKNIEATDLGAFLMDNFDKIAKELKVTPDVVKGSQGLCNVDLDAKTAVISVDSSLNEGDATQQLIQEISNFVMDPQLRMVADEAKKGNLEGAEAFAMLIEKCEWYGALGSRKIFLEAQSKDAEWTKGGASRWGEEAEEWDTYWKTLKESKAHEVYKERYKTLTQS